MLDGAARWQVVMISNPIRIGRTALLRMDRMCASRQFSGLAGCPHLPAAGSLFVQYDASATDAPVHAPLVGGSGCSQTLRSGASGQRMTSRSAVHLPVAGDHGDGQRSWRFYPRLDGGRTASGKIQLEGRRSRAGMSWSNSVSSSRRLQPRPIHGAAPTIPRPATRLDLTCAGYRRGGQRETPERTMPAHMAKTSGGGVNTSANVGITGVATTSCARNGRGTTHPISVAGITLLLRCTGHRGARRRRLTVRDWWRSTGQ